MAQGSRSRGRTPQGDGDEYGAFPREDLPYKVELWTEDRSMVEQVLALAAQGGIGYAAYHAATREYPERYVTISHRDRVLSRWNPRR